MFFVYIFNKCKYGVYMHQFNSDLRKTRYSMEIVDIKRALLFFKSSVQK